MRAAVELEDTVAETAAPESPAPSETTAVSETGKVRPRGAGLRRPRVSPWVQAGLIGLGAVLMAVGVAGLVLPGIQGVVTILAGLVVVSLGSPGTHRWTRRSLRRWPRLLGLYEKMRRTLLRRRFRRVRPAASEPGA